MNPANSGQYALAQKRANLLSKVKKNGIAELFSAASDIGAMAGLEDHVCLALLKAAGEKNELLSKESPKLREKTINDGLAEGRALAKERSQTAPHIPPVPDLWENPLADIPECIPGLTGAAHRIIHRSIDGREQIATADILTFVLKIPPHQHNPHMGIRIRPIMELNGWRRHRSGLVKVNGKNERGYWRFSNRWGAANDE